MGTLLVFLWYIVTFVQTILAYGTAYRFTKAGGDNGVALFGGLFLLSFASWIPGLGIFLWYQYRDEAGAGHGPSEPDPEEERRALQAKKVQEGLFRDHGDKFY